MDERIVRADRLDEERLRAFRRAAGERGVDSVVDFEGRPYVVSVCEEQDGEAFRLEPIPRPFG